MPISSTLMGNMSEGSHTDRAREREREELAIKYGKLDTLGLLLCVYSTGGTWNANVTSKGLDVERERGAEGVGAGVCKEATRQQDMSDMSGTLPNRLKSTLSAVASCSAEFFFFFFLHLP